MESQFAFLCAGVTPQEGATSGGLTAEGFPITVIPVTGATPVIPAVTLVAGVTYSVDEVGLKDCELRLLGPDGTVAATRTRYQFTRVAPGDRGMLTISFNIAPVAIDEFGNYEFCLHVGDELVATVPVTVVQQD